MTHHIAGGPDSEASLRVLCFGGLSWSRPSSLMTSDDYRLFDVKTQREAAVMPTLLSYLCCSFLKKWGRQSNSSDRDRTASRLPL
jgi:hypothetical protein